MTIAAMRDGSVGAIPPAAPVSAPSGELQVIETRFGPMEFSPEQAINMPRGVLGFAEHKEFGLAYLPNKFIEQLMLLQSLADAETSFLVLPITMEAEIVEKRDLASACNTLDVDPENAIIALIVTIRDAGGAPQITVNLRAPIILDANTRTGWQYVLPNSKYSVRHALSLDAASTPESGAQ